MTPVLQLGLLAAGSPGLPALDARPSRTEMGGGAWFDHHGDWLPGADAWFDLVRDRGAWNAERRPMYDRMVDVPRLVWWPSDPEAALPELVALRTWFENHYERSFRTITANWYRDGRDSVAMHRDRVRTPGDTIVAIVSLGGRRPLAVKPVGGGRLRRIDLGHGDLFVMGGTFQATHQHGVPKVAAAEPRISLMFRT